MLRSEPVLGRDDDESQFQGPVHELLYTHQALAGHHSGAVQEVEAAGWTDHLRGPQHRQRHVGVAVQPRNNHVAQLQLPVPGQGGPIVRNCGKHRAQLVDSGWRECSANGGRSGKCPLGAPEALPDEAWQRVLDTNLLSIARSNRVFLPLLLKQGSGHVVNTASASGLLAYGYDRLPYVASKHAVVGLTEALAICLGPRGIGVTCLCPSGVMTNILEQITTYGDQAAPPRAPEQPTSRPTYTTGSPSSSGEPGVVQRHRGVDRVHAPRPRRGE